MIHILFFRAKKKLIYDNRILEEHLNKLKFKYKIGNLIQTKNYGTSRKGLYSDLDLLPNYIMKWKNSFYELHQDIAEEKSNGNLSDTNIHVNKEKIKLFDIYQGPDNYMSFVVHCYGVIPSNKGPMLCLEDPFGSILTNPVPFISQEIAKSWVNRMLIADIDLNNEKDDFNIKRIQTLKYNLYDKIKKKGDI